MTRRKLNLAYIANDSMRKATFNKRKKGFVKKINELSVLCGIEACAMICSPFNSNPEVWPSNSGVKNIVKKFERLTKTEQEKKMVNHEDFLIQNISKTMESNNKRIKENTEKTMKEAMFQLLSGNEEKLNLNDRNREDLCKYIDQYLKELYHHKNQSRLEYGESSSATNDIAPTSLVEVGSYSFPNLDVFNSSRVTNDLRSLMPLISSSSQRQDQVNTTFSSNFLSNAADQQGYYPVINPMDVYAHNPDLNHPSHSHYQYQQQFGYPIVTQDGIYNPSQNENQPGEWLVDQMVNYPIYRISFSLMDHGSWMTTTVTTTSNRTRHMYYLCISWN